MDFTTTLYLDKRRPIKGSKNIFPVKLKVYSKLDKKKKLYSINENLNIEQFEKVRSTENVKGKLLNSRLYLNDVENRSYDIAKGIKPFSFKKFEKLFFRDINADTNVKYHYLEKISNLEKNDQIATASNYELSLKSLGMFLLGTTVFDSPKEKEEQLNTILENLKFSDIDDEWLDGYEQFMLFNDKSFTTISMYLRCLRTIFNDAIALTDITKDIYPFGKSRGQYQIPAANKKKKALNSNELNLLFSSEPEDDFQLKAKHFWFLSFALNGMNFKDILLLKHENMKDDKIVYLREKTKSTKKTNLNYLTVFLNDYSKTVIDLYKTEDKSGYLFDIVSKDDDAKEQKRKIKNFISHINLHFNKFATSIGVIQKVTTYWARHSFATTSIQKGASLEFISEALNHSNVNVTKNYFAGFEDETKRRFSNDLMNF